MPQIVEYTNREGITPTDRGTEARVQQGRRIGASFNQVAESIRDFGNRTAQQLGGAIKDAGDAAVQYAEHREVNQGIDTYWQLRNTLENQWADTIKGNPDKGIPPADPHDPAVAQRFMTEKLSPALQDWSDTFQTEGGRRFAQARVDSFLDHMGEKTAADMGTLAADQIDTSLRRIANNAGNIAYRDPSAVPHLMDDVRSSVGAMIDSSPNLKGATAARAKTELTQRYLEIVVKSGVSGAIAASRDPEATAAQWSANPKYTDYFSGPEAATIAKAAKVQAKNNELVEKQAAAFKRQQEEDAVRQGQSKIIADNVSVDPQTGRVTLKPEYFSQSLNLVRRYNEAPNASQVAQALINWGQAQQRERRETIVSDPNTKDDLYTRLWDNDNPTTQVDIMNAETVGKLDRYDAQNLLNLRKAIEDQPINTPGFKRAMDGVKAKLGNDPVGKEMFASFFGNFVPEFQRLTRLNQLPPDALDFNNPNSMVSKAMAPFIRDGMTIMRDRIMHGAEFNPGQGTQNPRPPELLDMFRSDKSIERLNQNFEVNERNRAEGAFRQEQRNMQNAQPTRPIPSAAVQMLRNNPSMRKEFDTKYGEGQASKILGTPRE